MYRHYGTSHLRNELGYKLCTKCETWKPESEFTKVRTGRNVDGLFAHCRSCVRFGKFLYKYGLTQEQYEAIVNAQGGICANPLCTNSIVHPLGHVDHDHRCCPGKKTCGKCLRGILCKGCNFGIGWFEDDGLRLIGAATYVRLAKAERG